MLACISIHVKIIGTTIYYFSLFLYSKPTLSFCVCPLIYLGNDYHFAYRYTINAKLMLSCLCKLAYNTKSKYRSTTVI